MSRVYKFSLIFFLLTGALSAGPINFGITPDWHAFMKERRLDIILSERSETLSTAEKIRLSGLFSNFTNVDELDQAALRRISEESSEEIRVLLARIPSVTPVTSEETFRLALQIFRSDLVFESANLATPFFALIGCFLSRATMTSSRDTEAFTATLRQVLKSQVLSDLRSRNKVMISRYIRYLVPDSAILTVIQENFSSVFDLLDMESSLSLLISIRNLEEFSEFSEQFKIFVQKYSERLLEGSVPDQIKLLKRLQIWKPPVVFRSLVKQISFSPTVDERVREAARDALYFSYGGYKVAFGTVGTLGFGEYDQKAQIFRNLRAKFSVRKDQLCAAVIRIFR